MVHDYTFKICILGDMGTGKTSLLERLCNNSFSTVYSATIGVDFKTYNIYLEEYDKEIKLQIWDTAGQEHFLSIIRSYFRKMAGCILVYDVTNKKSFNNLNKWIKELEYYCLYNPIVSLVGNKTDLINSRVVDEHDHKLLNEYFDNFNIEFNDISVKENTNIDTVVTNLTSRIYKHLINNLNVDIENYDIKKNTNTISHFEILEKKTKKKCCVIS